MDNFDPAINYGPNDAGVSALSIVVVICIFLISSWLFGAIYALVANYFKEKNNN